MSKYAIIILMFSSLLPFAAAASTVDSLRTVLAAEIANTDDYINKRREKISYLQKQKEKYSQNKIRLYDINKELFNELSHFDCGEAYKILLENISLAEELCIKDYGDEAKLSLSAYASSAGMYYDAYIRLNSVNRSEISQKNLPLYYDAYFSLFSQMAGYSTIEDVSEVYRSKSDIYGDSLLEYYKIHDDDKYAYLQEIRLVYNEPDKALKINNQRMPYIQEGTQEYAIAAYYRAFAYMLLDNAELSEEWFLRSAITDVRQGVTDNGSIWILADMAKNSGDIDLAYFYVTYGMENTLIFNAPMRRAQMAILQAVIGKNYESKLSEQNAAFQKAFTAVLILSLLLVAGIIVLIVISKKLRGLQAQLKQQNEMLKSDNSNLQDKSQELSGANKVKEEYVRQFMQMMSAYIAKTESSNRKISRLLAQKKTNEAIKLLETNENLDMDLQDFYKIFDESFLRMYPDFIDEFNKLLKPEARFEVKSGEPLPAELRIFALIRLGITDSSEIADFLRYSPNTIYNYRARVKNNAIVERSLFEEEVQKIGAVSDL